MKSALSRLRESQDLMSATERAVSDHLLSHPEEAMGMSIHQLAEKTFASPSTVIRMCQRIGFAGYKEFRQAVTCEVAVRRMSQGQERREIGRSDTLDDIVDKVTCKNIMSLEDTRDMIDTETLQICVDLLSRARTVLLFGLGASLYAARDLNLKLLRLNKSCVINDDGHTQLLQAKNATEEDLAIVVSYSGETAEVVQCMNALRGNHTPIVAVTGRGPSQVAELADYHLFTTDDGSSLQKETASARMSQLNLVDILFAAYANSDRELDQPAKARLVQVPAARAVGTA